MKKGLILVLALVLLLGGAGFLYGRLSTKVDTEQLGQQEETALPRPISSSTTARRAKCS